MVGVFVVLHVRLEIKKVTEKVYEKVTRKKIEYIVKIKQILKKAKRRKRNYRKIRERQKS